MKEVIEKLEQVEEIMQLVINKLAEIEKRQAAFPEIKIPDHTGDLNQIKERLNGLPDRSLLEKLHTEIHFLKQKIGSMPAEIPVREHHHHHHHFDKRSTGFIIGGICLFIVTAITTGLSLSLWSENQLLHENSLKFRMIRIAHPSVAAWVDSTYYRNPGNAERVTEQYEAEAATRQQAEATAKQKEQEAKQAREKVKELKKK